MWIYPQPAQAKPNVQENQTAINQVVDSPPDNGRGVLQPQVNEPRKPSKNVVSRTKRRSNVLPNKVYGRLDYRRSYSGKSYSKEEVETLIRKYSDLYGISSDTPRCIAFHESGYNQYSRNKTSSASGVFQYLSGTWKATDEGKAGLSVFDADANVRAAVKYMSFHKSTKPWTTRTSCPPLKFNH
jgi:hypothetical protein